jgi:hypothetical protein
VRQQKYKKKNYKILKRCLDSKQSFKRLKGRIIMRMPKKLFISLLGGRRSGDNL